MTVLSRSRRQGWRHRRRSGGSVLAALRCARVPPGVGHDLIHSEVQWVPVAELRRQRVQEAEIQIGPYVPRVFAIAHQHAACCVLDNSTALRRAPRCRQLFFYDLVNSGNTTANRNACLSSEVPIVYVLCMFVFVAGAEVPHHSIVAVLRERDKSRRLFRLHQSFVRRVAADAPRSAESFVPAVEG